MYQGGNTTYIDMVKHMYLEVNANARFYGGVTKDFPIMILLHCRSTLTNLNVPYY